MYIRMDSQHLICAGSHNGLFLVISFSSYYILFCYYIFVYNCIIFYLYYHTLLNIYLNYGLLKTTSVVESINFFHFAFHVLFYVSCMPLTLK